MSAEELAVYLRLTPEFGGTRFGPYEELEVRLGSDGDRCHIVLSETLGVQAEHARVIRQGPQNLILAPAERTATIFLWKQGARRPTPLGTLTAIRPGDSFSLVTETGPRFIVELDELPEEIREARSFSRTGVGRSRLSAKSMGSEVKRQAWTTLLVQGPAQIAQRAVTFVRSGAIYQPRNIILGVTIAGGWLFGGASMCSRSRTKGQMSVVQNDFDRCRSDLTDAEDIAETDPADYNFAQLAGKLTRNARFTYALEDDPTLRAEVEKQSRLLLSAEKQYAWLLSGKDQQAKRFSSWRERVADSSSLDEETKLLVTWLAAMPNRKRGEYAAFKGSLGATTCGRGPVRMTWRQALSLGMDIQPDAVHEGPASRLEKDASLMPALITGRLEEYELEYPDGGSTDYATIDSNRQCVFVEGDDDRTRDNRVLSALERHLGEDGSLLPSTAQRYQATARLAKYWAADFADYRNSSSIEELSLDFSADVPGNVLQFQENGGQWAMEQTARVMAQALAIPCLGVLSGKGERMGTLLGEENVPTALSCLIFQWKTSKG